MLPGHVSGFGFSTALAAPRKRLLGFEARATLHWAPEPRNSTYMEPSRVLGLHGITIECTCSGAGL